MLKLFAVILVGKATAFSVGSTIASPRTRASTPVAFELASVGSGIWDVSTQLASIIPNGVDYQDTGNAFWESASAGDLPFVLLVGVGFPTAVTLVFYKDNLLSIFDDPASDPDEPVPPGWKKQPSESRPGKYSYLNIKTKERFDRLPNGAWGDA